jgi:hypothetical protein
MSDEGLRSKRRPVRIGDLVTVKNLNLAVVHFVVGLATFVVFVVILEHCDPEGDDQWQNYDTRSDCGEFREGLENRNG